MKREIPHYYMEQKTGGHLKQLNYNEANGVIYCMYDLSKIDYKKLENKTRYKIGKRVFSINKDLEGKALLVGGLPSAILNKLNDFGLRLRRVNN